MPLYTTDALILRTYKLGESDRIVVFLTRDRGANWTGLTPTDAAGPRPVVSLTFDPADSNSLYSGTPHLAWKTYNAGATWRRISADGKSVTGGR